MALQPPKLNYFFFNIYMNRLSLAAAALAATVALEGCASKTTCNLSDTDPSHESAEGIDQALQICAAHHDWVMECLVAPSAYTENAYIQGISCADPTSSAEIADAFSDTDFTSCIADSDADAIEAGCQ
jgi:hypothetical protein